jgi:hypothetical protein
MLMSVAGAWAQPPESTEGDRVEVAVTAYNNGLALVRDVRRLTLPRGESGLKFSDVAALIRPETVSLRSLSAGLGLRVVEQNYEYDLVSPQKLMEKYVGRNVRLVNFHKDLGFQSVDAELLSLNEGPVYRVNGEIFLGHPGHVALPEMPENLTARPSLVWNLDAGGGDYEVEASYLTNGMSWRADYVVTLALDDRSLDLAGWVTLDNQSGATFSDAKVKLVAGDVNRVQEEFGGGVMEVKALLWADGAAMPEEEAFAEFHLYTLPRRTTIKQNQSKQVALLAADGVKAAKKYEYRGQVFYYSQPMEPMQDEHVEVFLEFRNEEKNALGIPLPAGVMRIYQEDSDGMLQFAGEDRVEHTPKDETVRLRMGSAFDVIGERVQTDYEVIASNVHESGYRVTLRNHKEQDIVVDVVEPMPGDWRILSSSMPFEKRDAQTAVFSAPVKAGGEVVITYRARVRY